MDRSEFMYRYIEECMYPICLGIILWENYTLRDDRERYRSIVYQFQRVMDKFIETENAKIEEEQEELLAFGRQEVLKRILNDVSRLFDDMDIDSLKTKLMREKLDDEFFLQLCRELRKGEMGGK